VVFFSTHFDSEAILNLTSLLSVLFRSIYFSHSVDAQCFQIWVRVKV